MEYHLHMLPSSSRQQAAIRIVPPRPGCLRRGGGRKSSPGWTDQKLRTNRRRFDQLRPHIQTGVTVIYPANATPDQLAAMNACNRNFCKEKGIPARAVWEGPGYHQHIALGIPYSAGLERLWRARLRKRSLAVFGVEISPDAFLWKPDIEPDKIASYLSKTRKDKRICVKCPWPWMTFAPCWEVGFRFLVLNGSCAAAKPRKKRVTSPALKTPPHSISPSYTGKSEQTSERKNEILPGGISPPQKHQRAASRARPRASPIAPSWHKAPLAATARSGYPSPMSVATLQQFGQSLPSWLDLVRRGETVAIVDGGQEVARLVPPAEAPARVASPVRWPDFAARRRAVFGDVVLPAGTAAALVNEDRGA